MITAETKDGFAVELSDEALDNVELLDALAEVQDADVLSLGRTICWTGAACRCGWLPRWPPVCRRTADV